MGHMEKAPGLGAWGRVLVIVRATVLASGLDVGGWAWCSRRCSGIGVLNGGRPRPLKGVRPRPLLSFMLIPAVSYSPTPFRVQYHQRCGS